MWFDENLELMKLQRAEQESLTTGKLTPLLKEELKYFVQNRRMSEGKHELVVDFETVHEKSQALGPEERARRERRREQNRRASEKLRCKKKAELQSLMKVCADLEKKNKELLLEVGNLQTERDALYEMLMSVLQVQDSGRLS